MVTNIATCVLDDAEGDQLPQLTAEQVKAAIWDLVKQAQVSWKANKPRPSVDANGEERIEEESEAAARNTIYIGYREQRLKINARKKTVS